ncbi:MAG: preQ(1) synthase [Thermodesulfobacteriota bacterium]
MPEAEGMTFEFKGQEHIRPDFLQTIPLDAPQQYIKTQTKEFVAVCPFSGLPDIARLTIEYYPKGGKCIELKSLKYYITSFKDVGIYQEEATRRIYQDLRQVLDTDSLRVSTRYNVRGGFLTTAVQGEL